MARFVNVPTLYLLYWYVLMLSDRYCSHFVDHPYMNNYYIKLFQIY